MKSNHISVLILTLTGVCVEAAIFNVPGDHRTIQGAIDAAAPGDEIIVSGGLYRERIRLKPRIRLRSAGDDRKGTVGLARAERTVIDGGGISPTGKEPAPGVSIAQDSIIDGFTVRNVGRYDDARWKKHHVARGANQLHEHIGGFGVPGIGADGVSGRIINNVVHHNGHTGIALRGSYLKEEQYSLVENNICYRNMGGGIGIMAHARGRILGNTCFENFYAGIGHSNASPLVQGNECSGNIRAGIGISEGASPTVQGNKCHHNRRAGIGIRTGEATKPIVEDNDCYENGMAGIGIDEGAAPVIRANRCLRNEMAGIGARHDAKPIIEGNEVRENKLAGIGFEACDAGIAVVRDNAVSANGMVAIGVQSGWKVRIINNTLSCPDGMPPVIMVFKNAKAIITGNTVAGPGVAGIRVAGAAEIRNNIIHGRKLWPNGPPQFGVWALPGSCLQMSGNSFKRWRHALYASGSTVTATDNTAETFVGVAYVVEQPSAPATVSGNVAITSSPKDRVVKVDNEQGMVSNNRMELPAK
ncbi:MAG: right-handed parallel beta-helix repeat-containing protein [Roseibacillus sp.]|nr:right-handed parallel beta-helix repeat-containing protein [Roseibacillus sp.]